MPSLLTNLYASRALYYAPPMMTHHDKADKDKDKDRLREGTWHDKEWDAGWHAAAGAAWSGLGSATLSKLLDDVALETVGAGHGGWDARLAVLERRAMQLARSGKAEDGLCVLLSAVETADRRRGMGLGEFGRWQRIVWEVVRVHVERSERPGALDLVDRLSPPAPLTSQARAGLGPEDQDADAETLCRTGKHLLVRKPT